jgi:hypothetical protein
MSDVMKELTSVRKEVSREYQWFQSSPDNDNSTSSSLEERRKRLLYLFVKDLSPGLSGEVVASKQERDSMMSSLRFNRVPMKLKFVSWLFVIVMNMVMLFYVYLFALRQSESRQSAWLKSFLVWLVFEIAVSSTGLVLLFHLLIPLFVLSDVAKVKAKVLRDFIKYRDRCATQQPSLGKKGAAGGTEVGAGTGHSQQLQQEPPSDFNAAKYFYTSWRVASLTSSPASSSSSSLSSSASSEKIPESDFILTFATPWPQKKFGSHEAEVSSEYDQDVLLSGVSRIALYFLTALFQCHVLIQDIVIQVVWTGGFGYLGVVSMRLYHLHPLLPVAVLVGVCLCVYLLMRYLGGSKSDLMETLEASAIHPLPPPLRNTSSSSSAAVVPEVAPVSTSMTTAMAPSLVLLNLQEPFSVAASAFTHPIPPHDFPSLPPLAEEEEKETSTTDSSAVVRVFYITGSSATEVDRFFISDEEGDHSDGSSSLSEGSSPSESSSSSLSSSSSVGSSEIIILERELSASSDHPSSDT